MAAGVVYLLAVRLVAAGRRPPPRTALLLGTGLLLRALALPSAPVLEDDFNRYLWDGAVAASGLSPYAFPPSAVLDGSVAVPRRLLVESLDSGGVLRRVNHPRLTTIYPPVAQAAFLLAPLLLAPGLKATRKAAAASALYVALTAALLLPMAGHATGPSAGVVAYASGWTMNGAIFPLFSALLAPLLGPAGVRVALAAAFAGLALFVARTAPSNPGALLRRASFVPAALLLLGPTAFPWYFT